MSKNKEEIRYILNFIIKKGRMRLRILKKFDVYEHDTVSVRVARSWFKRF